MRSGCLAFLTTLAACGGGGGGAVTPPSTSDMRLAAAAIEVGPGANGGELVVQLAGGSSPGAALLQVAVELPPQLTLPLTDRLVAGQALATLDGDFVGGKFVVLCGDTQTAAAPPLAAGPLFRLRVLPTQPRQVGDYAIVLHSLRAASAGGDALAVASAPVVVPVSVR